MEDTHKENVKRNFMLFTELFRVKCIKLMNYLFAEQVLEEEDVKQVMDETAVTQKTMQLLDFILANETTAFKSLYASTRYAKLWRASDILEPKKRPHEELDKEPIVDLPKIWPPAELEPQHELKVKLVDRKDKRMEEWFNNSSFNNMYEMGGEVKGQALIINNQIFDQLSERRGSEHDKNGLVNIFEQLGFEVQAFDNQTSKQMQDLLDKEYERDHTDYKAFILVILTHGGRGIICGTDTMKTKEGDFQNTIAIKDIWKGLSRVESLRKKPKVLFIQSCQGKKRPIELPDKEEGPVIEDFSPEIIEKMLKEEGLTLNTDTDANVNTPATDTPATDTPAIDTPATDAPATDMHATDAQDNDSEDDEECEDEDEVEIPDANVAAGVDVNTPATDTPATDTPATDAPTIEGEADDSDDDEEDDDQELGEFPEDEYAEVDFASYERSRKDVLLDPADCHFLLAQPTTFDNVSYRNIYYGSWFIQAVIYVFANFAHMMDLQNLMLKVNKLVSRAKELQKKGKKEPKKRKNKLKTKVETPEEKDVIKNSSVTETTFMKKLYFFPGMPFQSAKKEKPKSKPKNTITSCIDDKPGFGDECKYEFRDDFDDENFPVTYQSF